MPLQPLVVVPVRDGVLPAGAAEAVAEGIAGGPARVVLIGSQLGTAAGDLSDVSGVDAIELELAEVGEFAVGRWSRLLAPLVDEAAFVLLAGSPDGRDLAARLAAVAGVPLISGALSVGVDRATIAHHGGLVQSVLRPSGPFVATLQPGVRGVERHAAGTVRTTMLDLASSTDGPSDVVIVEVEPPDAATMDLAEAPRIIGGGAGLLLGLADDADRTTSIANRFAQLTAVAERIGASMGATRVVTDAGFVPHTRQIGTTGVVVDPDLYLAFGISGAVQHTAGLGNPDHVISVNTDPHCPMMSMADLALVADANATLDELARLLGLAADVKVEVEVAHAH